MTQEARPRPDPRLEKSGAKAVRGGWAPTAVVVGLALGLAACGPKEIPEHLRPDAAPLASQGSQGAPTLELLVGRDPLLRRPDPGPPGRWIALGVGIEAWAAVARRPSPSPADFDQVEFAWPSTVVVPLCRGARLAALEAIVADQPDTQALAWAQEWLGIRGGQATPASDARGPLEWLGPHASPESLVVLAERAVVLGWLDAPGIDVTVPVRAMQPGVHDRVVTSPVGQLLVARAARTTDPAAAARGSAALLEATLLALEEGSADRDAEQAQWFKRRDAALEALRQQGMNAADPVAGWLQLALRELLHDASDDRGAARKRLRRVSGERAGAAPDARARRARRVRRGARTTLTPGSSLTFGGSSLTHGRGGRVGTNLFTPARRGITHLPR